MPLFSFPKLSSKIVLGILTFCCALLVYLYLPDSCPEAARRTAFIFVLSAGLWAFEIFPLPVASLVIVLMLIFGLARPDGVLDMDRKGYTMFLVPFASPIIMLFFGGFMLSRAMQKYQVDKWLAEKIIVRFGHRPYCILLGLMLTTALLSMWISNTAATAIMMGIVQPFVEKMRSDDPFRKGLVLAVPFSANLGGIGTPIGSPPNAIALGMLSNHGIFLSFIEWMAICVPLMIILLLLGSLVLRFLFSPEARSMELFSIPDLQPYAQRKWVLVIAFFTIVLFITSPLHGIPEPLTALLCAGILTATGLLSQDDIKKINWDILILMWGGLALGTGVKVSGLGDWIVDLPIFDQRGFLLVSLFCVLALGLSLFISNTAAAALLLPFALDLHSVDKVSLGITIALSCGIAMIFPVSTPPNAIAYATGLIKNRDMVKAGSLVAVISLLIILVGYSVVIPGVLNNS